MSKFKLKGFIVSTAATGLQWKAEIHRGNPNPNPTPEKGRAVRGGRTAALTGQSVLLKRLAPK